MLTTNITTNESTLLRNDESHFSQLSTKFPEILTFITGSRSSSVINMQKYPCLLINPDNLELTSASVYNQKRQTNNYLDNFDIHADFPPHKKIKIKARIKSVKKFKANPTL